MRYVILAVAATAAASASGSTAWTRQQQKLRNRSAERSRRSRIPSNVTIVTGPGNYYANINTGVNGDAFRGELTALLINHTVLTYNDLWTAFVQTDTSTGQPLPCANGQVGDVYSYKCWDSPAQQCGNYQKEGDCFNREHVWPKSNWGGATNAAYTDLQHLHPSDGYDNGRRSNYPLGFVNNASVTYATDNGSLLGACVPATNTTITNALGPQATQVPATQCWEPADIVKGALARTYMYVSVAYWDTFTCCTTDANVNAEMLPWLLATMLQWHGQFPPSAQEQARNDAAFALQGSRNPFVDYPDWAAKVWGI